MKISTRILLLLLLCLFSFSLYAQDIPHDIARILNRGTLIVAILKQDVVPFHWHDDKGDLQGYDIDLAKDMAQRLGVKVSFYAQSMVLDDLADDVLQGKADVIVSYSLFTKRAIKVIYTKPQVVFNQVLLVNNLMLSKNQWSPEAENLLQKPNITVGVLAGSNFEDILHRKYPNIKVVTYTDIERGYEDVKNGKILAIYYIDKLIERWLAQHPDANLYTSMIIVTGKHLPMGMAVSWRDNLFMHWIDTYIAIIETDGTLDYIKTKYFGNQS